MSLSNESSLPADLSQADRRYLELHSDVANSWHTMLAKIASPENLSLFEFVQQKYNYRKDFASFIHEAIEFVRG